MCTGKHESCCCVLSTGSEQVCVCCFNVCVHTEEMLTMIDEQLSGVTGDLRLTCSWLTWLSHTVGPRSAAFPSDPQGGKAGSDLRFVMFDITIPGESLTNDVAAAPPREEAGRDAQCSEISVLLFVSERRKQKDVLFLGRPGRANRTKPQ